MVFLIFMWCDRGGVSEIYCMKSFAIFVGCISGVFFENTSKMAGRRKVKIICDLRGSKIGIL